MFSKIPAKSPTQIPPFFRMARMARAVLPGVAHHLTQRGVNCQDVFFSDAQRQIYLRLAAQTLPQCGVAVLGYCLMTNHVHWVVVPSSARGLARAFGILHGRYAQHMNTALGRTGHFWQNRFFSCALDESHMWAALRYVERNPVRAGVVTQAGNWQWSSAGVRLGLAETPIRLAMENWREQFTPEQWQMMLAIQDLSEAIDRLRMSTYTGRPAGEAPFIQHAEVALKRKLERRTGGRPRKSAGEAARVALFS